jgi:hypothetical protein
MVIVLPVFLEQMSGLLPAEKQGLHESSHQGEPFQISYPLNCDLYCADFHEDLDFKFSGVRRLIISSFTGKKANSTALTNSSEQVSVLYIIVSVTGNGLLNSFIFLAYS